MPVVTVRIPEAKADPLVRQLLSQLQTMQRQLQKLQSTKSTSSGSSDKMMQSVLRMMERMMAKMTTTGSTNGMEKNVGRLERALARFDSPKRTTFRTRTFGSNN